MGVYKRNKLNIVLFIYILINIIGLFIVKDAWIVDVEAQQGWQYQISKILYGVIIIIMLPSLIKESKLFKTLKWFVFTIFIYIAIAYVANTSFSLNSILRFAMLCMSFLFFYEQLSKRNINIRLLKFYIISLVINVSYLTIIGNQVSKVIETGRAHTGQPAAIALVYSLPLIFYIYKPKVTSYFYLFALVINFISLRRTSILALLLCLPFIYATLKKSITKKQLFYIAIILFGIVFYIVSNYWEVIELRFYDMFLPSEAGYYGSGRTGWFALLWDNYLNSHLHWLFGFGLGAVSIDMEKGGFPYGLAHNDFLEIIYTFGIWGFFCWFSVYYKVFKYGKNKLYKMKIERNLLYMSICTYLFVAAVSGAIFNANALPISLFLCLLLTDIEKRENKVYLQ